MVIQPKSKLFSSVHIQHRMCVEKYGWWVKSEQQIVLYESPSTTCEYKVYKLCECNVQIIAVHKKPMWYIMTQLIFTKSPKWLFNQNQNYLVRCIFGKECSTLHRSPWYQTNAPTWPSNNKYSLWVCAEKYWY